MCNHLNVLEILERWQCLLKLANAYSQYTKMISDAQVLSILLNIYNRAESTHLMRRDFASFTSSAFFVFGKSNVLDLGLHPRIFVNGSEKTRKNWMVGRWFEPIMNMETYYSPNSLCINIIKHGISEVSWL